MVLNRRCQGQEESHLEAVRNIAEKRDVSEGEVEKGLGRDWGPADSDAGIVHTVDRGGVARGAEVILDTARDVGRFEKNEWHMRFGF